MEKHDYTITIKLSPQIDPSETKNIKNAFQKFLSDIYITYDDQRTDQVVDIRVNNTDENNLEVKTGGGFVSIRERTKNGNNYAVLPYNDVRSVLANQQEIWRNNESLDEIIGNKIRREKINTLAEKNMTTN